MIDLKNVTLSFYDGKPIKNKLPAEIKERFKTKLQWLDKGMQPKENAQPVEMHPQSRNKLCIDYYLDEDVEPLSSDIQICATCCLRREMEGMCPVAGDFVSPNSHCSEWMPN